MKPLGIYVHIPFCQRKCNYCDFCSASAGAATKSLYVDSLMHEIAFEHTRDYLSSYKIDSIFLGGGTPTCLSSKSLIALLEAILRTYNVSNDAEVTLECNPGTVDFDSLYELKIAGFNRISFGLQSANDNELNALGRIHGLKTFDITYNNARRAGFSNVNIDIMYGIPYQTLLSFGNTLEKVISYCPEHVSAYSLKIEPGTNFFENRSSLILPDEEIEYNMYMSAISLLKKSGYRHYEISNYAKPGKESHHNLKYWNCDDYVGFGISSHSCIGNDRYEIISSIEKYISYFQNGFEPNYGYALKEESLNDEEFAEEYIMMRLRLADGLSIPAFNKRFNLDFDKKYMSRVIPYIKSGHIIYDASYGNIRLTDEGMYVSNYILTDLLNLE